MKKLICIVFILLLFTVNVYADTMAKAAEAIAEAQDIIMDSSESIPHQFKFDSKIKYDIEQADACIAEALRLQNDKQYVMAFKKANEAIEYSAEAQMLSHELTEKTETEIRNKIKAAGNIDSAIVFEIENCLQQKNYYEALSIVNDLSFVSKPARKQIKNESGNKAIKSKKSGKVYKMQPGDNLWSIAKKVYGDPVKWVVIYTANNIKDFNLIYPGQILKI